MKRVIGIILGGVFLLTQATAGFAATTATKTFNLQATVPTANGINIEAYKQVGTNEPTKVTGLDLDFETLTLDPEDSVFRAGHFFFVQVTPQGAGDITTTVSYTEAASNRPVGATRGLGSASIATFVKAKSDKTETQIGTKTALTGLNKQINPASVTGGWLKVYIGLANGDETITGVTPFTTADKTGDYTGTITFSATAQ